MDKKHLNKIVDYLLDDTEIHYEYQSLQIIGSDIEYDIERLSDRKFFNMMWDKLEFDYGLNSDDRLYVYGNYLYQINKKIKLYGSINESVDNKERYLDKIVDYMVEDTTITPNFIFFPFMTKPYLRSPYGKPENLHFHLQNLYKVFSKYCQDTYGLTDIYETFDIWEKYKTILIGNKLINESVDNKEKYLDKISQYILDDTKLEYGQKEVIYPFIPNVRSQWGLLVPLYYATIESPLFNEFSEYCNDTYGLTYEESVYVWDQYKVIFNHKINSKPMNESINSRGDYLDKVIEYMVDDTIIDYNYKSVNLLFLDPPMLLFLFLPGIPPEILEYCNYVYGLNDDETNYVWRKYRDIIVDNFDRKKHQ